MINDVMIERVLREEKIKINTCPPIIFVPLDMYATPIFFSFFFLSFLISVEARRFALVTCFGGVSLYSDFLCQSMEKRFINIIPSSAYKIILNDGPRKQTAAVIYSYVDLFDYISIVM